MIKAIALTTPIDPHVISMPRFLKSIVILLLLNNLAGCSSLGVEPWQREILSRSDMQFGSEGLTSTFSQHFYFSKEASAGGQGFAGGGCGCN